GRDAAGDLGGAQLLARVRGDQPGDARAPAGAARGVPAPLARAGAAHRRGRGADRDAPLAHRIERRRSLDMSSFAAAIDNRTPFAAESFVIPDPEGQEALLLILSASFQAAGPQLVVAEQQAPI